ncbi:unnamed protein product [Polarella glacialis]|uniref:Zinc finger CCHC domain-containing protein 10 n=1 Tax=Polarella glacialis TaxID=89957 RepID=A0A813HIF3_POLGL|nr:unnamed protein product [Polarella glacialis]|mmetsp:Transcript_101313/g.182873  ORF Transcript_101313/g.182873 Transcript_101313/m.182873 type:complete len:141 (-) Transcript_101313:120-542(-)
MSMQGMLKGGASAAAKAKVICQQCLQPGHWTYECKGSSTYQVRASATKQLKVKRFKQPFMEEEAPDIPENNFLGDDRQRGVGKSGREEGSRDAEAESARKKQKTDQEKKDKKEKKKKTKKEESSSSSSSGSDSDSSSSSS